MLLKNCSFPYNIIYKKKVIKKIIASPEARMNIIYKKKLLLHLKHAKTLYTKKSKKKIVASLEACQSSKCPLYLDLNSRNFSSLLVS